MGGASVVGLAGCVGGGDGGDGGGTNEFVASAAANPGTFDPTIITDATSNSVVGTMAYERLIALTFDYSEFRGELASSYEQVDDTTFRFQLREGVTSHNSDE
jgi:peptide/nickel transport system substrate-binding protein